MNLIRARYLNSSCFLNLLDFKVHIFWEGTKVLQNLHQLFVLCTVQRAELTCHLIKTRSICVKNIWIFARFLKLLRSCWEKSRKTWGDTEKKREKLEANCTGFSAEFFGSQSVEMFCFARKTKIQMLTNFCWSLFSLGLSFLKLLQLNCKFLQFC